MTSFDLEHIVGRALLILGLPFALVCFAVAGAALAAALLPIEDDE